MRTWKACFLYGWRLQRAGQTKFVVSFLLFFAIAWTTSAQNTSDPLPSWNDGPAKQSIFDFIARVTRQGSPDFVAPEDRIATFDNDGTLWTEQPIYTEFAFVFDRVGEMAPQHPERQTQQPHCCTMT